MISGCIFAYVFEDVLGLSSPLKACHLITALSSVYSLVGTCQSPARQLILTDGLPLSSWCGAWVFVNTWINSFNPKTNSSWKKQAEKAFHGVFSNSPVHGFFGFCRASCTNGLWTPSRLRLTGPPRSLLRSWASQGKKGAGNTGDAHIAARTGRCKLEAHMCGWESHVLSTAFLRPASPGHVQNKVIITHSAHVGLICIKSRPLNSALKVHQCRVGHDLLHNCTHLTR